MTSPPMRARPREATVGDWADEKAKAFTNWKEAAVALRAERERCAGIAHKSAKSCDEDTPGGFCAANQARSIEAEIREGRP